MPPRVQPHHVPIPSSCQCFRTRPRRLLDALPRSQQTRHYYPTGGVDPKKPATRRDMMEWLNGPGKVFRDPLPGSTNYMCAYDTSGRLIRAKDESQFAARVVVPEEQEKEIQEKEIEDGLNAEQREERFVARQEARSRQADIDPRSSLPRERFGDLRPYPMNISFRSERVLSEELREELYTQVVERGMDVSTVSAAFGVDIRRVAAVVRLKTIEKRWIEKGQALAKPYNDAVMAMLPQTPYQRGRIVPHESINDLPVHPQTRPQLFWPTSESRHFTREDAAKAFGDTLLPADKRIPHPELITLEKERHLDRDIRLARQRERDEEAEKQRAAADEKQRQLKWNTQRIVRGRKCDFKFQDISAEKTGKDGRARNAVGARYGMPHEDRKRGMVKIPTSVE